MCLAHARFAEEDLPELLLTAPFPSSEGLPRDEQAVADLALAQTVVAAVRRLRQQNDVAERKPVKVTVAAASADDAAGLERAADLTARMGCLASFTVGTDPERPEGAAADVVEGLEVLLDLDGLIDKEAQRESLQRNLAKVEKNVETVSGKLSNEAFVAKAPEAVVAKERARLEELEAEKARLEALLAALG